MSHGYVLVAWNRRKRIYDACLWIGIAIYIAAFIGISNELYQGANALSPLIVLMRALSTCAFLMLTIILCIGPLARIDRRFLPLLYNRRHFGVSMFMLALAHAAVAIYWYHGFGVINPIVSVFTSGGDYQFTDSALFPNVFNLSFQVFGAFALAILFLMAATSHDYWNANLGGPLWKAIHMLVYLAYALIVIHITFGALQQDDTGLLPWMVGVSVLLVGGLHVIAGRISSTNATRLKSSGKKWIVVGNWKDIPNNKAIIVSVNNKERIAIFRYDENKLAAVSNVCQHQNGPLGEGRVIDGLITCPWHGFQYKPEDGCSPPPFTEKIKTYRLAVDGELLAVDPIPLPPGTPRAVVEIL